MNKNEPESEIMKVRCTPRGSDEIPGPPGQIRYTGCVRGKRYRPDS